MDPTSKLATAVAAVLAAGAASEAIAAAPSLAQAQNPKYTLYIAGSSAAKSAVLTALENDLFGGSANSLIFSSVGDTNFFAVSGIPATTTGVSGANGSNVFTVYYRDEGGSVVGALPLVSGKSINQLYLSGTGANAPLSTGANTYTVTVTGSSAANGLADSFSGGVTKEPVQMGITDVEPGVLIGDNYPSLYSTSAYGSATPGQLSSLAATPVFQQVFGVFVNTNSSAFTSKPLSLSKATVTNLLQGNTTDWSTAVTTTGAAAASSLAVTIVDREAGSGSRTAAAIYLTDDEINPNAVSISDPSGGTADYFSTGNVLAAANTVPGAITYASIDNLNSTYPNLTLVAINGVTPSNLAAAEGQYDFWYEATVTSSSTLNAQQQSLVNFLTTEFQNANSAPHAADILLIPGAGTLDTPAVPVSSTSNAFGGGTTIYVNPFTRNGSSTSLPGTAL